MIIQASSLTKDYQNVFDTIDIFEQASITVNIVSLVGWTHVFRVKIDYILETGRENIRKVRDGRIQ